MEKHFQKNCIVCKKSCARHESARTEKTKCCRKDIRVHEDCIHKNYNDYCKVLIFNENQVCLLCGKRFFWHKSEKIGMMIAGTGLASYFINETSKILYPQSSRFISIAKTIGTVLLIPSAVVAIFTSYMLYSMWNMDVVDDDDE
jgi:hypothetical protein